jgi:hypothetical protein
MANVALEIPTLWQVFWSVSGEILAGIFLSAGFAWFGAWQGDVVRLRNPEKGRELFSRPLSFSKKMAILLGSGGFILILVLLDRRYLFFALAAGYFRRLLLFLSRSLLLLLMYFQSRLAGEGVFHDPWHRGMGIIVVMMILAEVVLVFPAAVFLGDGGTDKNGVILQTTGVTCAPASLSNILKLYGVVLSESDAARVMRTTYFGTLVKQTIDGARRVGFSQPRFESLTLAGISPNDEPMILLVKLFGEWDRHAVALLGVTSETLIIADPLKGLVRQPKIGFDREWRGAVIRMGPSSSSGLGSVRLGDFDGERFRTEGRKQK